MAKFQSKECPRCGQMVSFWGNRKVCVSCRLSALQTPEHKEKARGWRLVNEAIKAGRLIRQPCEVCGAGKSDAHHDDYTKPFSIRWLCRFHHQQHHKNSAKAA